MKSESRKNGGTAMGTPEAAYTRGKCAEWLWRVRKEARVAFDTSFFECLRWSLGSLSPLVENLNKEMEKLSQKNISAEAFEAVRELRKSLSYRLPPELEQFTAEHPHLQNVLERALRHGCGAAVDAATANRGPYHQARQRLSQVFGIKPESALLCESIFFLEHVCEMGQYFGNSLQIQGYANRHLFACMLGISPARLQACMKEVTLCGLVEAPENYYCNFRLREGLAVFWDGEIVAPGTLFCRPLQGDTLPLDDFCVPSKDVEYAKALLEQADDAPVHILLYGPSGTGKTTFAHSLAASCGIRAWSVPSRDGDDDDARRASLTACLHMASRHKRSFVLVDEAERLLDTDMNLGRQTKDKAWLNDLLEQPGRRVIWVTNRVRHLDQAVRRRFTFSIHFKELSKRERLTVWRQILARHRVQSHMDDKRLGWLAQEYPVAPGIIENAVSQAQKLSQGEGHFADTAERSLDAYLTLRRSGRKEARVKQQKAVENFSLDGVCLEGSAHDLLDRCRRVSDAMRDTGELWSGCATMLFYGPPGTGKTALARHIAKVLDRECLVKRASDLLSPWVGVAEQQVAETFMRAEEEGAVLIIDEADSFLYSRDTAQRSWETSLVNEFLTALEECRCFCICTTNRRENMDAAAMRRFSHKVAFGYAKPEQALALYAELLNPLCAEPLLSDQEQELIRMPSLTPGDFHAVRSQYGTVFGEESAPTHQSLIAALRREQALKVERQTRRIGFNMGA
ncbi:ATP-binding protein [Desulfovibrio sp. OttesenSCG-928-G15]|nr:ATP-binding protein [Desulfovibrio sp. OttesenSCG-928-G15]